MTSRGRILVALFLKVREWSILHCLVGSRVCSLLNKLITGFLRMWCLSTLKKFWRCIQGWTCTLGQISHKFLKFKDGKGRSCTSVMMPEVTSRVYTEKSKVRLSSQMLADSSTYGQWVTIYVLQTPHLSLCVSYFLCIILLPSQWALIPRNLSRTFVCCLHHPELLLF